MLNRLCEVRLLLFFLCRPSVLPVCPSFSIGGVSLSLFTALILPQVLLAQSFDSLQWNQGFDRINAFYAAGQYQAALREMKSLEPMLPVLRQEASSQEGNYYRSKAHLFVGLRQLDSAIHFTRKAWKNFRLRLGKAHAYTHDLCYELGYVFHQDLQYDSAQQYYQQALGQYRRYQEELTDDIPLTLHQIGIIYANLGLVKDALPYAKEAFTHWEQLYPPISSRMLTAHETLGGLYKALENWSLATYYLLQAHQIATQLYWDQPPRLLKYYQSLASLYAAMGDHTQWKNWLSRSDSLVRISKAFSTQQRGSVAFNWGKFALSKQDYQAALAHFTKSVQLYETALGPNPLHRIYLAGYYMYLARSHQALNQHLAAQAHWQTALDIYQSHYPQRVIYVLSDLLDDAWKRGDTLQALSYAEQVWAFYTTDTPKASLAERLHLPLEGYPSGQSLKIMLRAAEGFWQAYLNDGRPNWLQFAHAAYQQLDRWYDPLHQAEAQLNSGLIDTRMRIYQGLLLTAEARYQRTRAMSYLTQAFESAEYLHAFPLFAYLSQSKRLPYHDAPAQLLKQENICRANIAFLSAQVRMAKGADARERYQAQLKPWLSKHDSIRVALSAYARSHFDMIQPQPLALTDVQQQLEDSARLLLYSQVDTQWVVWSVSPTSVQVRRITASSAQHQALSRYKQALQDYAGAAQARLSGDIDLAQLSYALYRQWVQPFLPDTYGGQSLIIVPDGALMGLSFESLRAKPAEHQGQAPYLLQQYAISYAHSASLYAEQSEAVQAITAPPMSLASFAPNYDADWLDQVPLATRSHMEGLLRNGWYHLAGAQEEARSIAQQLAGDLFLGEAASKASFLSQASEYRLLHLAMHAWIDSTAPLQSSLVFARAEGTDSTQNHHLYAAELFSLELQAELVVLSACHTSFAAPGPQLSHYSLAKAFQYAGSPALVTSLWQVSDQATQQIMKPFYRYLAAGKNKAESLRLAKLDYLAQVQAPEQAHPFFWAAFVLHGNRAPLTPIDRPAWGWISACLLGLGFMAGLGLWWYKRK